MIDPKDFTQWTWSRKSIDP